MDPGGPIIGIDLGTTVSAVAFLNGYGRAEVIPDAEGELGTPSVVLFPPEGGAPLVGRAARERSAEHPDRVAEFVKREMGDPDWRLPLDGRELTPPDVSAVILRTLLDSAEARLGERPRAAVITCPAYFGDLERQHTADAGRLAGVEVLSVFNEPTAAALAYGLHHAAKDERVRALVYDLGGGTFDVTVLELHGRRVRVLATAGEHRLGGKDWDDELVNYVAEEFLAEHGQDPRDELEAQQDLRNRCEAAKVALSARTKARVFCRAGGETTKVELTRKLFDEVTRPLLEQTQTYVEQVLETARLGWEDVDVILPVGGSSHMPQVRELLGACAGRTPETVVDPELSVCRGAAYYAALVRAEQGFDVKVLPPPAASGRGAPAEAPASLEETPEVFALPGRTGDDGADAPLGLPGRVDEDPRGPQATYAVASAPGSESRPRVVGALRGRVADTETRALPGRPGTSAPPGALPGRSGAPPAPGALPGRSGEASPPGALPGRSGERPAAQSAPPGALPGRSGERPAAQSAPPGALPGRSGEDAGAEVPPAAAEEPLGALRGRTAPERAPLPGSPEPAPGAPPVSPTATAVYDFSDVVALDSGGLPPAAGPEPPAFVTNVNARSLGVLVHREGAPRTSVMIQANSPLPASHRSQFFTIHDGQTAVKVVVLEGDAPDPEDNTRIGECIISGLPPRRRGQRIEIVYGYDADGRIQVVATDVASGQRAHTTLQRPTSLPQEAGRATTTLDGIRG